MSLINPATLTDNTVHTAADHNGPIATIVNDYNGNITNANISASAAIATSKIAADAGLPFGALLATIFSGQITSSTNAGTAGGTIYQLNLGGLKLVWGQTNACTTGTSPLSYGITYPASFFTNVRAIIATASIPTGFANQYATVSSSSASAASIYLTSPGGAGTAKIDFLAIGT